MGERGLFVVVGTNGSRQRIKIDGDLDDALAQKKDLMSVGQRVKLVSHSVRPSGGKPKTIRKNPRSRSIH